MIIWNNKEKCSGCGACAAACPHKAIDMQQDEDGFFYPVINEKACVTCNVCEEICLYQSGKSFLSEKETYAAVATDCDLSESSSGGLFVSFAQTILSDGGVVCGCEMDLTGSDVQVHHVIISDAADIIRLKGSKYVQSEMFACYRELQKLIQNGKKVLFCGTPCQVAGLRGFLKRDYENLFCLDIVCHGVPSASLFAKYLHFVEKKQRAKITSYQFRNKTKGWKLFGKMVLRYDNEEERDVFFKPEKSSYYQLFLDGLTYRKNCYSCPYACDNRPGDITLGDYWGIEVVHPEMLVDNGGPFDEKTGLSCMIINTEHGRKLMNETASIRTCHSSYEKASRYNAQLRCPSVIKPNRDKVLRLARGDYAKLDRWFLLYQAPKTIRRQMVAMIPKRLKRFYRLLREVKHP